MAVQVLLLDCSSEIVFTSLGRNGVLWLTTSPQNKYPGVFPLFFHLVPLSSNSFFSSSFFFSTFTKLGFLGLIVTAVYVFTSLKGMLPVQF